MSVPDQCREPAAASDIDDARSWCCCKLRQKIDDSDRRPWAMLVVEFGESGEALDVGRYVAAIGRH
ncbi:MAG TPA: hypothetical protein VE243_09945 [Candidatus Acidoferrum sp.]|nr:hypothetical protein [Candidatus Acidoferrum sp.]